MLSVSQAPPGSSRWRSPQLAHHVEVVHWQLAPRPETCQHSTLCGGRHIRCAHVCAHIMYKWCLCVCCMYIQSVYTYEWITNACGYIWVYEIVYLCMCVCVCVCACVCMYACVFVDTQLYMCMCVVWVWVSICVYNITWQQSVRDQGLVSVYTPGSPRKCGY